MSLVGVNFGQNKHNMKTLIRVNSAVFDTTAEKLWEVLTQPQWTEKYMFNCQIITDLKVGNAVDWKGTFQGHEVFLTGNVIAVESLLKFKYSLIDPATLDATDPNNFLHITYEIRPQNGKLLLTVINETYDGNEERIEHAAGGWDAIIFPGIQACL